MPNFADQLRGPKRPSPGTKTPATSCVAGASELGWARQDSNLRRQSQQIYSLGCEQPQTRNIVEPQNVTPTLTSAPPSAFSLDIFGYFDVELLSTHVLAGETCLVVAARPAPRQRRGRPGWEKVRWSPMGKGGAWNHVSGWQVQHCGHQTANWPYTCAHADGRTLVAPSGRGFRRLADAQVAVESLEGGRA